MAAWPSRPRSVPGSPAGSTPSSCGRSSACGSATRSPRTRATSTASSRRWRPTARTRSIPTGQRWEGHDGARAFYTELFAAFPDNRFALTDIVVGPQGVFEAAELTGTNLGPWAGVPASGLPVKLQVLILFPWDPATARFRGERIWFDRGTAASNGPRRTGRSTTDARSPAHDAPAMKSPARFVLPVVLLVAIAACGEATVSPVAARVLRATDGVDCPASARVRRPGRRPPIIRCRSSSTPTSPATTSSPCSRCSGTTRSTCVPSPSPAPARCTASPASATCGACSRSTDAPTSRSPAAARTRAQRPLVPARVAVGRGRVLRPRPAGRRA